jgi:methyltransferase
VPPPPWAWFAVVALVAAERVVELAISHRNARATLAAGGVEYGHGHFGAMKVLHTTFLVACAAEVWLLQRPFDARIGAPLAAAALAAQALRYWAIASLGRRWNVRVLVLPDQAACTDGPYRYLRHPNYLAVVVEGIALPGMHGAWITAALFTIANAALLRIRIRCEEEALSRHCHYQTRFAGRARWRPRRPATEAP